MLKQRHGMRKIVCWFAAILKLNWQCSAYFIPKGQLQGQICFFYK